MRKRKEIWEEVESNLEKGGEYKEDNNLLLFELLFDIRDALKCQRGKRMIKVLKGLFQVISILVIGLLTLSYTSKLYNNFNFQNLYCIITGLIIILNFERIFGEFALI